MKDLKIPKISKKEIKKIEKKIAKDFPDDFALQQVHIAREILELETNKLGLSYFDYILRLSEQRCLNEAKTDKQ